jgi:hypothetical protein
MDMIVYSVTDSHSILSVEVGPHVLEVLPGAVCR